MVELSDLEAWVVKGWEPVIIAPVVVYLSWTPKGLSAQYSQDKQSHLLTRRANTHRRLCQALMNYDCFDMAADIHANYYASDCRLLTRLRDPILKHIPEHIEDMVEPQVSIIP